MNLSDLMDALGKTGNPDAAEAIGETLYQERKELEKLIQKRSWSNPETMKLLTSAARALAEVGSSNDIPTLSLLAHEQRSYCEAMWASDIHLRSEYARDFEKVQDAADWALKKISIRASHREEAQKNSGKNPASN